MKRVKSDSAAAGVINRDGKKMVEIDNHCQNHDQPGSLPSLRKRPAGYNAGYDKVKYEVDALAEYHLS